MKGTNIIAKQFLLALALLLLFIAFATAQQREPRKLFPVDDDSAFIDINGNIVISASQPQLLKDIGRGHPTVGSYRRREVESNGIRFGEFSEGLATVGWARCPMCRNPFWVNGVIDETGRLVIPPTSSISRYGTFHEGLAQYHDQGVGFVDRAGRVKIRARFYDAADFSEGLALVRPLLTFQLQDKAKFGFINGEGKLVIPYRFEWASDFHDGFAAVHLSRGEYGYIDKTGEVVLQANGWLEVSDFSEGLAGVEIKVRDDSFYRGYEEERYGYIDRSGRFVIAPNFYRAQKFSEGRALVVPAGGGHGYGFIDVQGRMVIKPDYVEARSFSEGLAAVAIKDRDGKTIWGYINREGQWVIEPQFKHVNSFSGGLAAVDCDEYGRACQAYIDPTGRIVWQKRLAG
jgi:WG repeat protein